MRLTHGSTTNVAPLASSNADAVICHRTGSSGDLNFAPIVGSHVGNVQSSVMHPLKNKVHHRDDFGVLLIMGQEKQAGSPDISASDFHKFFIDKIPGVQASTDATSSPAFRQLSEDVGSTCSSWLTMRR